MFVRGEASTHRSPTACRVGDRRLHEVVYFIEIRPCKADIHHIQKRIAKILKCNRLQSLLCILTINSMAILSRPP